jgi:Leucine-rich repeat (LRR) protein
MAERASHPPVLNQATVSDSVDFSNAQLEHFFVPHVPDLLTSHYGAIVQLLLRNNALADLSALGLGYLPNLEVLDLAHNRFRGSLSEGVLPSAVQRLDISHNRFTNISGLASCHSLRHLNVAHNALKVMVRTTMMALAWDFLISFFCL